MGDQLSTLSASELSRLLDSREISPQQLLDASLARCERLNPILNSIVTFADANIQREVQSAHQRQLDGKRLSPLDGIPITIKDNIFVGGMRCTWGSRLFESFVPAHDDICIERLRACGAIVIGKTNTPEFALASRTDNLVFGTTRNPWDIALTPGGSSGGAAASVAAGLVPLALGTDAGGSIRSPASFTGLVGLRPTNGRIPRRYGFPPLALDFQAIGLLSRTVADVALLYDCLAGPDRRDPASLTIPPNTPIRLPSSIRIRVVSNIQGEPVDAQVRRGLLASADALSRLGYCVEQGPAPYDLDEIRSIWAILSSVGVARVLEQFEDWPEKANDVVRALGENGFKVSATQYVGALDKLTKTRAYASVSWSDFDVILSPTSPTLPWPVDLPYPATVDGQLGNPRVTSAFTTWVNAIGHPAMSVPTVQAASGLPIGVQLVGSFGAESLLLDIAQKLEALCPWADRWPSIC